MTKQSNNTLVQQLKENGEDFEFYPTTASIAHAIYAKLDAGSNILDIGAGNGNFFRLLENMDRERKSRDEYAKLKVGNKYAIEKSTILLNNLDSDVAVIGTDFSRQTLIDKKVDVIFSNPPYSVAEKWVVKIIREANAKQAFIVIPLNVWNSSNAIRESIVARDAKAECIMEYDYRDSEFRKARTTVGVYQVNFNHSSVWGSSDIKVDPFDLWFEDQFPSSGEKTIKTKEQADEEFKKRLELVPGRNLIERLETMYNEEFAVIRESYEAISKIPRTLLEELGIKKESIKKSLSLRLTGTKNKYWNNLFQHLNAITNRLTSKSREKMEKKLTSSTCVDYSAENAYAVVCWVLKNANSYFDEQLVSVYQNLTREENIKPYKSNQRFTHDCFRYNRFGDETIKNYKLDYRLILCGRSCCLSREYSSDPVSLDDYDNRTTFDLIKDLFTIASNLGFEHDGFPADGWEYGKARSIAMKNGETLAEVKIYKNGNFHFKLKIEFMKAFNVEAGRLLGWLKTPQQAAEELEIKPEECLKYFQSNTQITSGKLPLLMQ